MSDSEQNDIVISGIAGRYPECANLQEFWDKLLNGQELSSIDDRRWPVGFLDLPKRSGKIPDVQKFDNEFFEIPDHHANVMDPQIRIFHETTFEAIVDAGYDPRDLSGTKTGVFIGWCYSDTDAAMKEDESRVPQFLQLASNRLSMTFGFKGTAIGIDTACASSLSAFQQAIVSMRSGECDTAIVGGWAIHARPSLAVCFHQLGMISTDGRSKCMDARADGYCRSEAIVSVLLQRKSVAKRVYANILNARTNTDGWKVEGITFPSRDAQKRLMEETYAEIGLDGKDVDYVEAHMTGTAAGDPVESAAIADVLCKDRETGLAIGCLKSNMGHSEGASGLCAITKSCLIFQRKRIPPNIHLSKHNPNIEALKSAVFSPVTQTQAFHGTTIGINCFGFGGCNVHVVIRANDKSLTSNSLIITDASGRRLVHFCSRTRHGLQAMHHYLRLNQNLTHEWLALVDQTMYLHPSRGLNFRSFVLLDENREILQTNECLVTDSRPVVLFMNGFTRTHFSVHQSFLQLMPIRQALQSLAHILPQDMEKRLTKRTENATEVALHLMLYQILWSHLLKELGLQCESVVGSSIGNVAASFAAGLLSLEESVLFALLVSQSVCEENCVVTRVTGMSQESLEPHLPQGSRILSKDSTSCFVVMTDDRENGSTLLSTESSGASRQTLLSFRLNPDIMHKKLTTIIPTSRQKPFSWLLSGIMSDSMSAKDFIHSIVDTSDATQVFDFIDKHALCLEVGADALLESSLKQGLGPDISYLSLSACDMDSDSSLRSIGEMYLRGCDPRASRLYPAVEFPVPQEVDSISPLIQWNHSRDWLFVRVPDYFGYFKSSQSFEFDLMDPRCQYLSGHCVDGRILFPATGYLWIVWNTFALLNGFKGDSGRAFLSAPIEFRDVEFHRATILSKKSTASVTVNILTTSGKFCITGGGQTCVTGFIRLTGDHFSTADMEAEVVCDVSEDAVTLETKDIYKEMRIRGYDYGPSFQNLVEATSDGSSGKVKWGGNWVSFSDSLLQLAIVGHEGRDLLLPTAIQFLKCDIKGLMAAIENSEDKAIDVKFDKLANMGCCTGLVLKGLKASKVPRRLNQQALLESYTFTPNDAEISVPESVEKEVQKYAFLCQKLTDCLKTGSPVDEETVTEMKRFSSQDQSLLQVLKSGIENQVEKEQLLKDLQSSEQSLVIRTSIENEDLTRVPVDIVLENSHKMEVIELNFRDKNFFDLMQNLTLLSNNSISFSVTTSRKDVTLPPKTTVLKDACLPVECKASLVVINDWTSDAIFKKDGDFDCMQALTSCASSLTAGSFILLLAREKIHSFEQDLCSYFGLSVPELQDIESIVKHGENAGLVRICVRRGLSGIYVCLVAKASH